MSDDVVWQLVKNGFCSFRKTTDAKAFCTNMYNSTGLCNNASCPLANSNYATVIEEQGSLMLCLKTAERSHTPRDQWERIKLSKSKREALEQISQETKVGFPSHQTLKCKLRFRRLREVLSRMRNIILNKKTRVMPIKKKTERREAIRERKAEIAAKLDKSIEDELLNRLSQGVYGELYNFDAMEQVEAEPEEIQTSKRKGNVTIKLTRYV
ncbi:conserved hypothetical protein [Theileria equi strain WA]|uniref:Ribosomal eL28/Mak16 domain-containing protein n=1 Tax=Theileria equi strain WA TaxID=1537102 RepID=L1LDH9_THEEQ|nr:conserved hypothetical protein [Theileria equi strain WA]EKX73223.1 conserved hypothetical protein [Theileria equi strain WA]|eukprot:XP_004832675.1 conserved hypothetical protein [Theileria equi strain WA]